MPTQYKRADTFAEYLDAGVPINSVLRAIGDAGVETGKAILAKFGATRISELKKDQRAKVIEECYRSIASRKPSTA